MFFKPAPVADAPAGWIGCIGAHAAQVLGDIPASQRIVGSNFVLAAWGEEAWKPTLSRDAQGSTCSLLGDDVEAGCSARIAQDGAAVTLACDRFGLHGIYLARVGNAPSTTLWFASDPAVLQLHAHIPAQIRPDALHGYLCFSYVPTPTTLIAGIDALPAGSRATFSADTPTAVLTAPSDLWSETSSFLTSEAEAIETLKQKLRTAVARRLGSEREVGVFLSGGLDSSLVAALLVEAGARVQLFTLDFGPPYDAELPLAREVAASLKQPLHVVPARVRDVAKALFPAAQALQQPFGDAVTVPLMLLGKAAAAHVGTVFNGEFGDQLFGGWANKPMVAAELYGAPDYQREAAYLATFHRFYGLTDSFYTPHQRQATAGVDVCRWIRAEMEAGDFSGLLHRLRAANLRLKGAQNIGPRARQLAAACGLRSHAPFADRELAEWTFSCPPEWFLQGACEKYLLKRAAEAFLPASIVWREKRGMGVPATDWCRGGLRRTIARVLNSRRLKRDGWFRPEAVRMLRRGNDAPGEFRTRRLGEKLWTILLLHVWLDAHAGPKSKSVKGYREATDEMYLLQHGE